MTEKLQDIRFETLNALRYYAELPPTVRNLFKYRSHNPITAAHYMMILTKDFKGRVQAAQIINVFTRIFPTTGGIFHSHATMSIQEMTKIVEYNRESIKLDDYLEFVIRSGNLHVDYSLEDFDVALSDEEHREKIAKRPQIVKTFLNTLPKWFDFDRNITRRRGKIRAYYSEDTGGYCARKSREILERNHA
jgi:hypothetical protein